MQIYVIRNGIQEGPLTFEQVRAKATQGLLMPTDLAWYEGCTEWIQLARIPGVFASPPPAPIGIQPSPLAAQEEAVTQIRPWVRYWARSIDIFLFCICSGFVLGIIAPDVLTASENVLGLLFVFLWCFVEPIFLSTWGSTPGKALLRTTLRNADGSTLNYGSALSRSFDVWLRGLGIGFPLVSLITLLVAYNKLTKNGITSWDQSRNLTVTHKKIGPARVIVAILLFAVFIFFMVLGSEKA
jgi:hypothetical protein